VDKGTSLKLRFLLQDKEKDEKKKKTSPKEAKKKSKTWIHSFLLDATGPSLPFPSLFFSQLNHFKFFLLVQTDSVISKSLSQVIRLPCLHLPDLNVLLSPSEFDHNGHQKPLHHPKEDGKNASNNRHDRHKIGSVCCKARKEKALSRKIGTRLHAGEG